jgi:hypothetical protein
MFALVSVFKKHLALREGLAEAFRFPFCLLSVLKVRLSYRFQHPLSTPFFTFFKKK